MNNKRIIVPMLVCTWLALSAETAAAADFPDKAVRFVVRFTPGGPSDLVGRLLGQKLAELWRFSFCACVGGLWRARSFSFIF